MSCRVISLINVTIKRRLGPGSLKARKLTEKIIGTFYPPNAVTGEKFECTQTRFIFQTIFREILKMAVNVAERVFFFRRIEDIFTKLYEYLCRRRHGCSVCSLRATSAFSETKLSFFKGRVHSNSNHSFNFIGDRQNFFFFIWSYVRVTNIR